VITTDKVALFVNQEQLNEAARQYLGDHVEIRSYDSFFDYLKGLAGTLDLGTDSVRSLLVPSACSKWTEANAENHTWR